MTPRARPKENAAASTSVGRAPTNSQNATTRARQDGIARDGDPESIAFEETDTSLQIAWPGNYRLDGPAFVYTNRQSRRVSTIIGYPTQLLAAAERR